MQIIYLISKFLEGEKAIAFALNNQSQQLKKIAYLLLLNGADNKLLTQSILSSDKELTVFRSIKPNGMNDIYTLALERNINELEKFSASPALEQQIYIGNYFMIFLSMLFDFKLQLALRRADKIVYETFLVTRPNWDFVLHLYHLFKENTNIVERMDILSLIESKVQNFPKLLSHTESLPGQISPFGKRKI